MTHPCCECLVLPETDFFSGVAEAWVASDRKHLYASSQGLGQVFSFDLLAANFNADEFRAIIESGLEFAQRHDTSTTWVLSNHDVSAGVTRAHLVGRTTCYSIFPP